MNSSDPLQLEALWQSGLAALDISAAAPISVRSDEPYRRTYLASGRIYKLAFPDRELGGLLRATDLAGEFAILRHCENLRGIPRAVEYRRVGELEALVLERLPGDPLHTMRLSWAQLVLVLIKVAVIVWRLSRRSVSHNDILPHNILRDNNGFVALIDFDQATRATFCTALMRQFLGVERNGPPVHGSLLRTLKIEIRRRLPPNMVRLLKEVLGRRDLEVAHRLPAVRSAMSPEARALLAAWTLAQQSNASAPGRLVAYYSLDFEGYHFPGERSWQERWNTLRHITDYRGKRILELGCNLALLSIFLLWESGARAALAIDADEDILKAAGLVSKTFRVAPALQREDFDALAGWEQRVLEFDPDIVFALNVLNWVKDKKRLLNFLGYFRELVFEGHESAEIEASRLRSAGYRSIEIVGVSERGRSLLHCRR